MDRLSSLALFIRTAEAGSFTAAGRQLGISGSAVGKAIARMEARLGSRLFHRSTRSVTLTSEGAMFLGRCRRIVGELDSAEQELAESRGAARGRLRVSMPIAFMLVAPALSAFMRAYPDVQLDVDFSDRIVDVIGEGFDIVLRAGELKDSRLKAKPIGRFELVLVASPAYLSQRGQPGHPRELAAHKCLLHRFATSGTIEPWPLGEYWNPTQLEPALTANTIQPLIELAEHGHGIACLPTFAIEGHLEKGALLRVLDEFVEHQGTFRLVWPDTPYPSPKLRAFIDFMAASLFGPSGA